ncbi:MAG: O-antigen ligase family protein [Limisphaerales bacterium]
MNREAWDRWCERGILALVLAILVFGPVAIGATRTLPFLIIQGLTLGVMLLWGARFWLSSRPQLLWPPICWAVVAFTVYAIVRYCTADIEYLARQELIRILVYAFLFFAVLNNLHRQESTKIISCTLIFLAMAISGYAVFQFLTHSHRVWYFPVTAVFGASGTYISRNHLGGFLEMLLPLGLAYTLTSRLKPVTKVFLGYASLVILAGIAVTISRGTYASTAVALLLFFGVLLFHRTYRLPALVLLVVIVGAVAYYLPKSLPVQARLKPVFAGQGRIEEDSRVLLWQAAIRIWQENPWWGVGPAHYDYRFRQVRPVQVQLRPAWAHNDYLNTLAEWGLVGIGIVASAWVLLGLGVLKTWPCVRGKPRGLGEERNSNKFAFVLGASLGLAAILVHSVVDFNMHIPANAILAITLMALLSSHLRFAADRYWVTVRPWGKGVASVVVLAGLVYLGQQGWHHAEESVWLRRAAGESAFSPAQAACLKNAFAAEPMNAETAYAIGDAYRVQSSEGGKNYRELAEQAREWFGRSIKLNPWRGDGYLRYGWCLDWLGRTAESGKYFERAAGLEPNGYFVTANIGLHYVQAGDFAAAKPWFERSLSLESDNPIARNWLQIVNSRLQEAATNDISAKLNFPPQ